MATVSSASPAYQALAGRLRQQILAGAFPRGHRLPTEAELASTFGLSRQTVRQAFAELVVEGLVYRVPGRGTFATLVPDTGAYMRSFGSIEDLLSLSEDTELEVVTPLAEIVAPEAAERLRAEGDEVLGIVFRRLHDGVAFSSTRLYMPVEFGPAMRKERALLIPGRRSTITITASLEKHTSTLVASASQVITAIPCPREVSGLLDMATGDPSLRIERLYYDVEGNPVEYAINDFNPLRYSHRIELRRTRARPRQARRRAGGDGLATS